MNVLFIFTHRLSLAFVRFENPAASRASCAFLCLGLPGWKKLYDQGNFFIIHELVDKRNMDYWLTSVLFFHLSILKFALMHFPHPDNETDIEKFLLFLGVHIVPW